MSAWVDRLVPLMSFVLLVAVGLALRAEDFARLRSQIKVVSAGLLAPPLLLPLYAASLTRLFELTPDVAAGLLVVAVCPIGGISTVLSYVARASPALSVTLTGLSCLLSWVTIPLSSKGLELVLERPLGLSVSFLALAGQLALALVLPISLGALVRWWRPAFAERQAPRLERLAFVGVALVLLLIAVEDLGAFAGGLRTTVPLASCFVLGSFSLGWVCAALVTRDARDRFTVATEFGTRNVGIAILTAVTLLDRTSFARFAAVYFLTEIPLMLLASTIFRRYRVQRSG